MPPSYFHIYYAREEFERNYQAPDTAVSLCRKDGIYKSYVVDVQRLSVGLRNQYRGFVLQPSKVCIHRVSCGSTRKRYLTYLRIWSKNAHVRLTYRVGPLRHKKTLAFKRQRFIVTYFPALIYSVTDEGALIKPLNPLRVNSIIFLTRRYSWANRRVDEFL